MEDLIRAKSLLISEDEAEESFDEEIDDIEKPVDEESDDGMDMNIWEN